MVAIDGGNNFSTNNGDCDGFFDWGANFCIEFAEALSSPAPTSTSPLGMFPSISPSMSPSRSFAPSVSPSFRQSQIPTNVPSNAPSQAPSRSLLPTSPPSDLPSQTPTISLAPSNLPTISMAPTSVVYGICGDLAQYQSEPCVTVTSWSAFLAEIDGALGTVIFCSFSVMNINGTAAVVDKDINIVCPSRSCNIYGNASHLHVKGDTQVLISGITFTGSKHTAVHVMTSSYSAVTAFCSCGFYK